MPFKTRVKIRFFHADSAGIMFYGNLYVLAHEVFEEFAVAAGFAWEDWFANPEMGIPFKKVDADYFRPHLPGTELEAHLYIESIGESSFVSRYRFFNPEGDLLSELRVVNVFMAYRTLSKMPVPEPVRRRLEPLVETAPPLKN